MVFVWNQALNAVLTDFLQAREANICLTLEGLHMTPGQSLNMKISSSMSCGPKVQFLLVGNDINLTLWVTGAERFARNNEKKTCALQEITSSRGKLMLWYINIMGLAYMQRFISSSSGLNLPLSFMTKSKPFFLNISRFSISTVSFTAVRLRSWGLKETEKDGITYFCSADHLR